VKEKIMKLRTSLVSVLLLLAIGLAACAPAATATPEAMMNDTHDAMTEESSGDAMGDSMMETQETPTPEAMMNEMPTQDAMMDDSATPEAMMDDSGSMAEPAWYSVSLSDARTGQSFSINDLKGKVILVETMAQWCSNCMQQQGQVKALHDKLGARDDFVSIGLDIDPNEKQDALKKYVQNNGFDWLYSVPPAEVSREISDLYGAQFLNPPSTPILIIDRHGEAHPLQFGIKSADDLFQAVEPYLNENM
jgi:thiol-disulfide isomerase/thioredoxin